MHHFCQSKQHSAHSVCLCALYHSPSKRRYFFPFQFVMQTDGRTDCSLWPRDWIVICYLDWLQASLAEWGLWWAKLHWDGFFSVRLFCPVNIIPPILHTHLYLHVALTRRANRRSLGTVKEAQFVGCPEHWIGRYINMFSGFKPYSISSSSSERCWCSSK